MASVGSQPPHPGPAYQLAGEQHHRHPGTQLAVYVNGVRDAAPLTKTIGRLINSGSLVIGRQSPEDCASPYNGCWKGLLDDVRVYNRPLSATEVQALYR